ncbi:MAG: hypothetical protein LBV08_01390 [Clostridiales bacterium]|jgi:hypothetical protein|nr:hypothetical protein [Clostridiales bacterium]
MKKFIPACLISIAAAGILSVSSILGAAGVTVTLDGATVQYPDTQPQIVNNRTMVPLRATGEAFGLEFDWDEDARVVSFNDGDKLITHVVNQNYIYVNGVPVECDYASVIVENRVLFSVRMLAEALDKEVGWDGINRKVSITSKTSTPTPPPASNVPTTPVSQITKVESDKTKVGVGETVTFTVTADSNTSAVKLTFYGQQKILAMSSTYTESGSYRTFSLQFKPEEANSYARVAVYSSNSEGFKLNPDQIVDLAVTSTATTKTTTSTTKSSSTASGSSDAEIEDWYLPNDDEDNIKSGDTIDIVVYTNKYADSVWIEDEDEDIIARASDYTNNNSSYVWRFTFKPYESGDYYVCAEDEDGRVTYEDFYLTIEDDDDGEYDNSDILSIQLKEDGRSSNTSSSSLTVDRYSDIAVEIETGTKVDYLYVYDEDDNEVFYGHGSSDYDEEDGKYVWSFDISEYDYSDVDDMRFTVELEYEDDVEDTKTFRIYWEED